MSVTRCTLVTISAIVERYRAAIAQAVATAHAGKNGDEALAALLDQTASRQQPLELQMQGTGVEGVIAARIVGIDKDAGTITARITGADTYDLTGEKL